MVYEREVKFAEAKTLSREALELQERCTGRATRTWRLRSSEKLFATTHLARDSLRRTRSVQVSLKSTTERHWSFSEEGGGLENTSLTRVFTPVGPALRGTCQFARGRAVPQTCESNSPEWMAYLDARAAIAFNRGKYTEADRNWQQAAKPDEKILCPEDPNVVTMILRRGELHLMVG
jgi:hypothetical protein